MINSSLLASSFASSKNGAESKDQLEIVCPKCQRNIQLVSGQICSARRLVSLRVKHTSDSQLQLLGKEKEFTGVKNRPVSIY